MIAALVLGSAVLVLTVTVIIEVLTTPETISREQCEREVIEAMMRKK